MIVQCVKSILQYEKTIDYEIIVVDNNSEDDTEQQLREIYPQLKWVQMGYNSGFAKANNAGVKVAQGEYILYLNSDTILIEPIFEQMIAEFGHNSKTGIVGCRLLNKDKTLQLSYHYPANYFLYYTALWRRNPIGIKVFHTTDIRKKELRHIGTLHETSHTTGWITGAIMMMRRSDIEAYQLLWDEDFFMYCEDVELCYRVRKHGFTIQYLKSPQIIHLGGGSTVLERRKAFQIQEGTLKLMDKTRGKIYRRIYVFLFKLELRFEYWLEMRKHGEIRYDNLKYELEFYGIK